jgi:hypothetical protein
MPESWPRGAEAPKDLKAAHGAVLSAVTTCTAVCLAIHELYDKRPVVAEERARNTFPVLADFISRILANGSNVEPTPKKPLMLSKHDTSWFCQLVEIQLGILSHATQAFTPVEHDFGAVQSSPVEWMGYKNASLHGAVLTACWQLHFACLSCFAEEHIRWKNEVYYFGKDDHDARWIWMRKRVLQGLQQVHFPANPDIKSIEEMKEVITDLAEFVPDLLPIDDRLRLVRTRAYVEAFWPADTSIPTPALRHELFRTWRSKYPPGVAFNTTTDLDRAKSELSRLPVVARNVVTVLFDTKFRVSTSEILAEFNRRELKGSESTVKGHLSGMVNRDILTLGDDGIGYAIAPIYRQAIEDGGLDHGTDKAFSA